MRSRGRPGVSRRAVSTIPNTTKQPNQTWSGQKKRANATNGVVTLMAR